MELTMGCATLKSMTVNQGYKSTETETKAETIILDLKTNEFLDKI